MTDNATHCDDCGRLQDLIAEMLDCERDRFAESAYRGTYEIDEAIGLLTRARDFERAANLVRKFRYVAPPQFGESLDD